MVRTPMSHATPHDQPIRRLEQKPFFLDGCLHRHRWESAVRDVGLDQSALLEIL